MTTDMDRAYRDCSHDEMSDDSQGSSLCQAVGHGSISFGRFSVESLSWERWSVFSHNRCLEEVEKFKSPGLVAQKKAYFEEYYRRIKTLKALEQEQETAPASESGGSTCEKSGNHISSQAENTTYGETCNSSLTEESMVDMPVENETNFSNASNLQHFVSDSIGPNFGNSKNVSSKNVELGTFQTEITISGETCNSSLTEDSVIDIMIEKETNFTDGSMHQYLVQDSVLRHLGPSRSKTNAKIEETDQSQDGFNTPNYKSEKRTGKHEQAASMEGSESIPPYDAEIMRQNNLFSEQVNHNSQSHKDHKSVNHVKGAGSSMRNTRSMALNSVSKEVIGTSVKSNAKLDRRAKEVAVKLSGGTQNSLHKTGEKGINSFVSRSGTSTKAKNSAPSSSNRQPTETQSSATVPRPFSLSTGRRAAGSTSTNGAVQVLSDSKASNRITRMPVHQKNVSHLQSTSLQTCDSSLRSPTAVRSKDTVSRPFTFSTGKQGAAHTTNGHGAWEHSLSKASTRLVQSPSRNKNESYMQGASLANKVKDGVRGTPSTTKRSTNLVARHASNQQRECEPKLRRNLRSNDVRKVLNKVKDEPEFRRSQQILKFPGAQQSSFLKSGTLKLEDKKATPFCHADQTENGWKSRQRLPCWR